MAHLLRLGRLLPLALLVAGCAKVPFTAPADCKFIMSANPPEIGVNGATSTLTITLIAKSGAPVSDGTVVTFTTTFGSVTAEAKTVNGVAKGVLTSTGAAGKAIVTAFSGACGTATTDVTIGSGADTIVLSASPGSLPTGGGSVSLVATVFGSGGQPVSGASVVFTSTQGTLGSGGVAKVTDASGTARDTLTTNRTADVVASSGSKSSKSTVTVGTTGVSSVILSAAPVNLPASGGSTSLVAVVLGDNGPLAGVAVAWSTTAGTLTTIGVTTTDSNGQAKNTLATSTDAKVTAAAGSKPATVDVLVGGTKATRVDISVPRVGIQPLSAPDGFCPPAAAGPQLPVPVIALVKDDKDNPLADRDVIFYVDLAEVDSCGRAFGQFCGSGKDAVTAKTDATGKATVYFTMTQNDLNFCNCLASGTKCLPLCTSTCAAPCTGTADLFCSVAIKAVSGGTVSSNLQFIEYNK